MYTDTKLRLTSFLSLVLTTTCLLAAQLRTTALRRASSVLAFTTHTLNGLRTFYHSYLRFPTAYMQPFTLAAAAILLLPCLPTSTYRPRSMRARLALCSSSCIACSAYRRVFLFSWSLPTALELHQPFFCTPSRTYLVVRCRTGYRCHHHFSATTSVSYRRFSDQAVFVLFDVAIRPSRPYSATLPRDFPRRLHRLKLGDYTSPPRSPELSTYFFGSTAETSTRSRTTTPRSSSQLLHPPTSFPHVASAHLRVRHRLLFMFFLRLSSASTSLRLLFCDALRSSLSPPAVRRQVSGEDAAAEGGGNVATTLRAPATQPYTAALRLTSPSAGTGRQPAAPPLAAALTTVTSVTV